MKNTQRVLMGGTILASVLAGGAFGAAMTGVASAATGTPSPTATAEPTPEGTDSTEATDGKCDDAGGHRGGGDRDPSQGGHVGENGTVETLLTGDEAEKVTAAVEAEYPDATVQRVETDAEGSAYEAHIVLADGSQLTVKLDESFAITGTESRPGR
ncbi:hypothetical protein [Planctomonas deserti]|uniref:hypothetical protein n=1 Tax=Planctomonas deserti TaxID=2144185 RepID=UPI00131F2168|nr:hypothetical protein [Planctomonas deserti]